MKPDCASSPRGKVAFGSGVPPSENSTQRIGVFADGKPPQPEEETMGPEARPHSLRKTPPGSLSTQPASFQSFGSRFRGSLSPTEEPVFHAQTKITYSHIGSAGSEDDIRSRLRVMLSASSIRIEPEDARKGLSAIEIRLLVEELSKVGSGLQVECQNLTLGRCGLDDDAAEQLGTAIGRNRQLEVLNLWNNRISTVGGQGLGHGLASNSTLKMLNLRSNDLGPQGALGVAKGLMHNKSLTHLSMRYNWIGDDGAKACSALLLSNHCIRELDVSRNRIGSEGAQAIMKSLWHNCTLTELNLQLNQICDKGGLYIGSALSHNTMLKTLDIMDCLVADSGCVSIFNSLGANTKGEDLVQQTNLRRQKHTNANHVLQVLVASGNEIGDIGSLAIGQALRLNQGLVKLDLSRNRLMDQGATALANALEKNRVLRELNLSKNNVGDAGFKSIADAMRSNYTLIFLDVTHNLASLKANVSGIVENESLKTFRSDLHLHRAELATADGLVRGFQHNISNARENGLVQRPLEIFPNLSLNLLSLHSLENRLGQETLTEFGTILGEFLGRATQLLDLSLARNHLKCEHVKLLCFNSLVFLDLSQNGIGNAGMEYLISSFVKVKPGPRIRELDLTENTIQKVPPNLAHLTSLECLFLEGNHAIRMVALSAIQSGIKSVTQWLLKWASMQLDLADIAKGIVKNKQVPEPSPSASPTSTSPVGLRPKTSTRKNIGFCSEYPAMYPPEPCCAVFGNAKRFPTKDVEPTPGPADASPWVHRKEGETYQRIVFEETWRSAVSTQPKSYKGGAPLAHIPDLDDEQERAVIEARNQLLNEAFQGRSAVPGNWTDPRHPILVETGKETKILSKQQVVKPAGFQEKYGIKSIILRMQQLHPKWEICDVQIMRVLKKHQVLHCDRRRFWFRPTLLGTAGDMPPEPGAMPYVPAHAEQEGWKSRVQFVRCFNAVFDVRKHQGFAQFMLKIVKQETHVQVMSLARQYFQKLEINGKSMWDHTNQHEAGRRVRDFIQEVYIEPFKIGFYEDEKMIKNAKNALKRDPLRGDEISEKIASHRLMFSLFQHSDPPPHRPRESWLDSTLKQAADLAEVGPGSYDPYLYGSVGFDPYAGKSISLPLESPPNTVPGPGAYKPQEPCADKKIPPHYIKSVGGTILPPSMQELVLCQPASVHTATQWLEAAARSNGVQVKLLKQRDWLDTYEVGAPQQSSPKAARTPRSRQESRCGNMSPKAAGTPRPHQESRYGNMPQHDQDIEEGGERGADGIPVFDEQEISCSRTTIPPGFKWKELGTDKPEIGTQIFNESLATALKEKKLEFTQEELDAFLVPELSYSSYIKVEVEGRKLFFIPQAVLGGDKRQKWLDELYQLGVTKQRARNEDEETKSDMERPFTSGTSPNRQRNFGGGPGSEKRVFLLAGSKDDLDRVLGDADEIARVGLERSSKGPRPVQDGAGPAYNVPSTFDSENRLFSSPTRAGHVLTRNWLDYRKDAERNRTPGPGSFKHSTTDRTGKWEAPIERLTSGLPQSKACQGSYAYTMGLPRKMLPHMDPLSSARITPSVQTYESFTTDKTGKAITFLETCLSGVSASPTPRIAQKTPYHSYDLMFTCDPNNGVPGVGSYKTEPLIGSAQLISKPSVPRYSIGHDTHNRESPSVTHIPVAGLGMIGTNTDLAQRPQTIEARLHSSCTMVDGKTQLKSPRGGAHPARSRSQSPVMGHSDSLRPAFSRGAEVYTMPKTPLVASTRLRPRPPDAGGQLPRPPTRQLSTLMNMDPDIPGMQTYTITHTVGYDKNPIVRNAPQYTIPIDYEQRGEPLVYNRVDKDFAVSVITPRHDRTVRARMHDTQKDWTDPESLSPRALRGRHFAPRTSKSFLHSKKQPAADDLALMSRKRPGLNAGVGGGKGGGVLKLRMPPKTARN